jgi:hypothetical protein
MRLAQDYREKAAKAEGFANDPRQRAELRTELRAMARKWRHWAEQSDWLARQSYATTEAEPGGDPAPLGGVKVGAERNRSGHGDLRARDRHVNHIGPRRGIPGVSQLSRDLVLGRLDRSVRARRRDRYPCPSRRA